MKRRVISIVTALALCLSLCPTWALAVGAEPDADLCPHHRVHTEECGYLPPAPGRECAHKHGENCFRTETACVHQHAEDCYPELDPELGKPEPSLCTHECGEDSGCVTLTLSCPHSHDESCGYIPEDAGAPCAFVCRVCPIEDLIGKLPRSVTAENKNQVEEQLGAILALYAELTDDEQAQLDLSCCFDLQAQLDAANVPALLAEEDIPGLNFDRSLKQDYTSSTPFSVTKTWLYDTCQYTYTASQSTAMIVCDTGKLYLRGSKVISQNGAGVQVLSGGYLNIVDPGMVVSGTTYGLDIASGASAELSGGTFTGGIAAIRAEGGNFGDFLKTGYAYFDESGNRISLENVAEAKTVVVKACTDHLYSYTHTPGAPTHDWICTICKESGSSERCTFSFGQEAQAQEGQGKCVCGNTIAIAVDLGNLVYDGTVKAENINLTVTLGDGSGKELVRDTDYTVDCEPRTDVGEIIVTVTGKTYNGTFTKTYSVTQAEPVIKWDSFNREVDYTGSPVKKTDLPSVTITAPGDLSQDIRYSYKKSGDADFTDGLPTDAGVYSIKASLPEQLNYKAAETDPCLELTIKQIPALVTAPTMKTLTYDRTAQELVDEGTVRGGTVIEYALSTDGPYSTAIPTGTDAGTYTVYYKVDGNSNYTGASGGPISVTIEPKAITPTIELSATSYVYDGGKKEPKITVRDGQTKIEDDQYTIAWTYENKPVNELRAVGTYTATVENISNKNYTFNKTVTVEIVAASQNALSITGKPGSVCYGDTVTTLGTTGGSENGTVTWSIADGASRADIDAATGVLKIKDIGSITVKAVRTVKNYKPVEDTWTFTADPKPVTAEVTIAPKDYDRTIDVANGSITAKVKDSDLVNGDDEITIRGLTGTYDDANAGADKTVTLNSSAVIVNGAAAGKYKISYPATATAKINPKSVTAPTITLSGNDLQENPAGYYYYEFDGTEKRPTVTVKDGTTVIPDSNYTVEYSNNKNAGTNGTVTVKSKADGNYTFSEQTVTFAIKKFGAVLTSSPEARNLTFTGKQQELVTVGTADGGHIEYSLDKITYGQSIPMGLKAGTYTVYYKVVGDGNHEGSDSTNPWSLSVTIKPKEVISPVVTLPYKSYTYTGSVLTPIPVEVKDEDTVIPDSEYEVAYSNNINVGPATVYIINKNGGNYIVNGSTTFEITKKDAEVTDAPAGKRDLPYNGTAQELITAGRSTDGTVVYSLTETGLYSTAIPMGTARGDHTVYYKVLGDSNHKDSAPASVTASIITNTVKNPTIQVSPASVTYNEQKQEPTVTIKDDNGFLIADSEYTYTVADGDMTRVGKYTLTFVSTGGNYKFDDTNGKNTAEFEILPAGQEPLTIVGTREHVYYGDTIQLDTSGGNGTVTWDVGSSSIAEINESSGLLKIKGVGSVTVTATSTDSNYKVKTAVWPIYAEKKPVTAVVTAAARPYDRTANATVTATLQKSDLVGTDDFTITLSGSFEDANAGTDKKVIVISSSPSFTGTGFEKYAITYPATTTASISKADVTSVIAPTAKTTGLTYTGSPLNLLNNAGNSSEGTLEYSLDNIVYSPSIPTGTNAGSYSIWYRVKGDSNHNDKAGTKLANAVNIARQNVNNPVIELTPSSAMYDGDVKKPTVIKVKDASGSVIPESEYSVEYSPSGDWKIVGSYTVAITDKPNGNYKITQKTATFTIYAADQNPLSITNQPSGIIHFGDVFTLSTTGGSGNGAITWSSSNPSIADVDAGNGVVTIKGTGAVTITAEKAGTNYDTASATWTFTVKQKSVAVTVTPPTGCVYNGNAQEPEVTVKASDGTVLSTNDYTAAYSSNTNAGTATVTVSSKESGNYEFSAQTVNFNIAMAEAKFDAEPQVPTTPLVYNTSEQPLVNAGTTVGGIGTIEYRLGDDGTYSTDVPMAANAGTYKVWYKVEGTTNYTGIAEKGPITVTISPKTVDNPTITLSGDGITKASDGTYYYEGNITQLEDIVTVIVTDGEKTIQSNEYTVNYTPNSTENPTTITVTITDKDGGNYTVNGSITINVGEVPADQPSSDTGPVSNPTPDTSSALNTPSSTPSALMQTSVRNGTAKTVVNAAAADQLVKEATANQSKNVVIKPEITGDVSKTEVSIPASTVSRLKSATKADVTVSTPVADVTIPNGALGTLSSAGGTVDVVTEQEEQTVTLTLTAGGETVKSVPGGVTLTVPVEDAVPGTVAVLVHEDGTRETIRKAVPENGELSIPLDGSATVEIVDNSKEFSDVPATNWAADAVAFTSAHELFNGTSETTFSPDQSMSRAMLVTVLYNLEGRPAQSLTGEFSDVSSDAWYAEGVSWAAEKGITNGAGDGQFGPDDSVTREQFAVMLWRYAGSPAANGQALNFTDADQASDYAVEALRWAVANGILNGYGNGRLNPGGLATRAEAAQMLKNFMENT